MYIYILYYIRAKPKGGALVLVPYCISCFLPDQILINACIQHNILTLSLSLCVDLSYEL
jgi:hypothetical protein